MIRFTLACPAGHQFEGWFPSSASFDSQRQGGGLACPVCGDTHVDKALMAPAVATARRKEAVRGESVRVAANPPPPAELVETLRKIREHLTQNADYVGDKFAEEARRIHFEEVEKRGIYGEATPDEVRGLAEDGVEFHPLPILPEDHN